MLASRLRGSWDLAYARLRHPAQDGSHGSDQDDQGDKADVDPAEALVESTKLGALIVLTSPSIFVQRAQIAASAEARRIPSISIFSRLCARRRAPWAMGQASPGCFAALPDISTRCCAAARLQSCPSSARARFEFVLNRADGRAHRHKASATPSRRCRRGDRMNEASGGADAHCWMRSGTAFSASTGWCAAEATACRNHDEAAA